jgi:hypothetical protein
VAKSETVESDVVCVWPCCGLYVAMSLLDSSHRIYTGVPSMIDCDWSKLYEATRVTCLGIFISHMTLTTEMMQNLMKFILLNDATSVFEHLYFNSTDYYLGGRRNLEMR